MFAQGQADEQAGRLDAALADYRNALAYNPGNPRFQFYLAKALEAAGRGDEARSYLLNLLAETPGSGEINLELARIAARRNSMADAMRYYQGAIYGEWDGDPMAMRWQVRRELCEALLARGEVKQAAPDVLALAQNTPAGDLPRLKIVGQLLLRTQQWNRALDLDRTLLDADPKDEESLAGAAEAAFELGQYISAMEYFDRLPHERREQPELANRYEMNGRISDGGSVPAGTARGDESAASGERAGAGGNTRGNLRAANWTSAGTDYAADGIAEAVRAGQELPKRLDRAIPGAIPDRLDAAMTYVFGVENAAAAACGEPQGDDRALWLLGRSRRR